MVKENSTLRSEKYSRCKACGFSLLELVVVLIVIGVLVALLMPAMRTGREAARRMQCSNNLKQLALSLLNYHQAFNYFPTAMGGTDGDPLMSNAGQLNGWVALLPYLEQSQAFDEISQQQTIEGKTYPPFGPAPWDTKYKPWRKSFTFLLCPSETATSAPDSIGKCNYAFSIGDQAREIHHPTGVRGAFACGINTRLEDITDGQSNTILIVEIGSSTNVWKNKYAINLGDELVENPSLCLVALTAADGGKSKVKFGKWKRGEYWTVGSAGAGLCNTILPPNGASCAASEEMSDGIYSGGSLHTGGIHLAIADGSVRYISNSIDAGSPVVPTPLLTKSDEGDDPTGAPSPYGVWGALGTRSGGEVSAEF